MRAYNRRRLKSLAVLAAAFLVPEATVHADDRACLETPVLVTLHLRIGIERQRADHARVRETLCGRYATADEHGAVEIELPPGTCAAVLIDHPDAAPAIIGPIEGDGSTDLGFELPPRELAERLEPEDGSALLLPRWYFTGVNHSVPVCGGAGMRARSPTHPDARVTYYDADYEPVVRADGTVDACNSYFSLSGISPGETARVLADNVHGATSVGNPHALGFCGRIATAPGRVSLFALCPPDECDWHEP
jgi:hypothetical protein